MFSIHNFRECVNGIFSLVTAYDIIRDSGILDMYWGYRSYVVIWRTT